MLHVHEILPPTLCQYGLWSFQTEGPKLERFLPKNQHNQTKLLNFKFSWDNGEMSKTAKIWLSKSIFNVKNYPNRSRFFSSKNAYLEAHFLLLTFLITSIFKSLYFLKWRPTFDTSPSTKFSKFNNFLWVCWFIGKNLFNFYPLFENSTTRTAIT